jgi:hypothetical protein
VISHFTPPGLSDNFSLETGQSVKRSILARVDGVKCRRPFSEELSRGGQFSAKISPHRKPPFQPRKCLKIRLLAAVSA